MNSRDSILRAIRKSLPQSVELPDHQGDWVQYDDLTAQFASTLEFVGGECIVVDSVADIPALLPAMNPQAVIVSGVAGIPGTLSLDSVADPHDLAAVDLAVFSGQLGVAENAAVWVDSKETRHRVIYFIAQHLVLVLRQQDLVPHLHAAYERIQPDAATLGCFISGPSKTADIEQSLVKGAHGARTLKVFLTRN